jgi:hypothetical protein
MRRQVLQDVRALKHMLEHHQKAGLPEADLQVIRRGKALEYFSRHYGKVLVDDGRSMTVLEALVGINQLLDEETGGIKDPPPVNAEPFTRQFLRLFDGVKELPRDQIQKFLRGTGIAPSDFEARGWCSEDKKTLPPHVAARRRARVAGQAPSRHDERLRSGRVPHRRVLREQRHQRQRHARQRQLQAASGAQRAARMVRDARRDLRDPQRLVARADHPALVARQARVAKQQQMALFFEDQGAHEGRAFRAMDASRLLASVGAARPDRGHRADRRGVDPRLLRVAEGVAR